MMLVRTGNAETARELTQDALVSILCALRKGQLREPEKLTAYVYGIACNTVRNYLRNRTRQPTEVPLSPDMPLPTVEDSAGDDRRQSIMRQALKWLHPKERELLRFALVEGLTSSEIAAQLGLKAEVVRERKFRALKKVIEHAKKILRTEAR